MRNPTDKHECPLLRHEILWGGPGGCYEIQEVREDNMDMDLLPAPIDLEEANKVCEKCQWYRVNKN